MGLQSQSELESTRKNYVSFKIVRRSRARQRWRFTHSRTDNEVAKAPDQSVEGGDRPVRIQDFSPAGELKLSLRIRVVLTVCHKTTDFDTRICQSIEQRGRE